MPRSIPPPPNAAQKQGPLLPSCCSRKSNFLSLASDPPCQWYLRTRPAVRTLQDRTTVNRGRRGCSHRVRVEPHQQTTTSYHLVAEEFYFVLTGTGTAVLDGESRALRPGDFLRLPPGTRHAFVTLDEPLEMLDVHVPGCRPDRDAYFVEDSEDK